MDRRFACAAVFAATVFSTALASGPTTESSERPVPVDADAALAMLKEGNARFVQGESTFPNLDQDRRCLTTDGGQHPYVSILSCADSRVPPELVFDAGIGEVFAIRVAGNVADTDEIGTIEYGVGQLHTPLILVMGHTRCGAVTAVVQGAKVGGNVSKLVDNIAPAVETAREKYAGTPQAKFVGLAVKENVRQSMADLLRHSEQIRELVAADKVKVVGAVYDIHNGTVEWLGELPNQSAILEGGVAEDAGAVQDHKPELPHTTQADARTVAAHAGPDPKEKASAASEPNDHAVPAAKRVEPKAEAHGEPRLASKKSPESTPSKKSSTHDEKSSLDASPQSAHDRKARDADDNKPVHLAEAQNVKEQTVADEKQSLVKQHGLLVPGAFLAAGSVLSGTAVFLLKGRARPAKPAEGQHSQEKPADVQPTHVQGELSPR